MKLSVLLAIVSTAQAINVKDKGKAVASQKAKAGYVSYNELEVVPQIQRAESLIKQAKQDVKTDTVKASSEINQALTILDDANQILSADGATSYYSDNDNYDDAYTPTPTDEYDDAYTPTPTDEYDDAYTPTPTDEYDDAYTPTPLDEYDDAYTPTPSDEYDDAYNPTPTDEAWDQSSNPWQSDSPITPVPQLSDQTPYYDDTYTPVPSDEYDDAYNQTPTDEAWDKSSNPWSYDAPITPAPQWSDQTPTPELASTPTAQWSTPSAKWSTPSAKWSTPSQASTHSVRKDDARSDKH